MAVDTKEKRAAALSFGSPSRSVTRPPTNSDTNVSRASGLGCYYMAIRNFIQRVVVGCIAANGSRAAGIARNGDTESHVQPMGTRNGAIK